MGWDLAIIAMALLGFAVVSRRLTGSPVTLAMVFVVVGFVLGSEGFDVFDAEVGSSSIRLLAEATLAVVLFADASALDTRVLQREALVPARLLLLGLPMTIALGAVVAVVFFPELGIFEALVLAVLLAPTDAALGQTVVADTRLPSRVRQGLNVESGLNDGICVPLLFAAIAFAELDEAPSFDAGILTDLGKEVGIALAVGVAVSVTVVFVIRGSAARGWLEEQWAQVVPLAAAALAYVATDELGGSGFIGAFVAGLAYGRLLGDHSEHTILLMDETGQLLSAVTFLLFGSTIIGSAVTDLDPATVLYAVASLTFVRMVPVAVAMIGGHSAWPSKLFLGWFGPRGLATIVFALIIVEETTLVGTDVIVQAAAITVLFSVFSHGITAPWLTDRYVNWCAARADELAMEAEEVDPAVMPRGFNRGHDERRPPMTQS